MQPSHPEGIKASPVFDLPEGRENGAQKLRGSYCQSLHGCSLHRLSLQILQRAGIQRESLLISRRRRAHSAALMGFLPAP